MGDRAVVERVATPDGPFTVVEDGRGRVLASGWSADLAGVCARAGLDPAECEQGRVESAAAVLAYYAGETGAPARVADGAAGTDLQRRVWDALRSIPAGSRLTYTQLAERVDAVQAVRAVAAACARNPAGLFVPCHRVIGADGSLTGFAWGIQLKRRLLEREGALPETGSVTLF